MAINTDEVERLRANLGMDQDGLAATAGLSQATVSRMERARAGTTFDVETARKVAAALGVNVDAIALAPPQLTVRAGSRDPLALLDQMSGLLDQLRAQIMSGEIRDDEARRIDRDLNPGPMGGAL